MYCSKCGSTIAETVTFCPVCGQSQAAGFAPAQPPLVAPSGPAEVTPHWQPAPVVAYAGFWLRVVAHILDGLIIGLPVTIVVVILVLSSGFAGFLKNLPNAPNPDEAIGNALGAVFSVGIGLLVLVSVLGAWLYNALFESSSWQATPGKKVLNLFVTDLNGAPVSFGRASGRFFAKFVTQLIPLGIGYMLAGLTERKQALHDMIASTLVLRR
ncbi:MAG: RDD family protein [Acidobacteria bacterium]|nr:RDD family protein [Acidobacteriota bacterium]MBS1867012.1 RDD family protein [Acidobacteriota bacterium]